MTDYFTHLIDQINGPPAAVQPRPRFRFETGLSDASEDSNYPPPEDPWESSAENQDVDDPDDASRKQFHAATISSPEISEETEFRLAALPDRVIPEEPDPQQEDGTPLPAQATAAGKLPADIEPVLTPSPVAVSDDRPPELSAIQSESTANRKNVAPPGAMPSASEVGHAIRPTSITIATVDNSGNSRKDQPIPYPEPRENHLNPWGAESRTSARPTAPPSDAAFSETDGTMVRGPAVQADDSGRQPVPESFARFADPPDFSGQDFFNPRQNAPAQQVEKDVHVHIGRIEIKAVASPAAPVKSKRARPPVMTLDAYLQQRNRGDRS